MPLWYPERSHVNLIRAWLAARFFPEYEETSPSPLFGAVQGPEGEAALDSALNLIHQPYYRGVYNKAGALLRSMIKNHPFVDGNKRIALVTTFDFLMMNRHLLALATNKEMVRFAVEVAKSEPDMPWQDVAAWIRGNTVPFSASKRLIRAKLRNRSPEVVRQRIRHVARVLDDLEHLSLST